MLYTGRASSLLNWSKSSYSLNIIVFVQDEKIQLKSDVRNLKAAAAASGDRGGKYKKLRSNSEESVDDDNTRL